MKSIVRGYNVVLLPSEDIKNQAIAWSKQLSQAYTVNFTLDGVLYHPHITLYQSNFPVIHIDKLKQAIEQIAVTIKPFTIELNYIDSYVNFIFYFVKNNPQLQKSHELITRAIYPLHDPDFKIPADLKNFPEHLAKNINQYGSGLIFKDYLPHVTLSRLPTDKEASEAIKILETKTLTMTVDSLYLTNVDHDGTCTEILEKFVFS